MLLGVPTTGSSLRWRGGGWVIVSARDGSVVLQPPAARPRTVGLSGDVCVVVMIDLGCAAGSSETGAPEGRAARGARRGARERTTYHHEHYAVQAESGCGRRVVLAAA